MKMKNIKERIKFTYKEKYEDYVETWAVLSEPFHENAVDTWVTYRIDCLLSRINKDNSNRLSNNYEPYPKIMFNEFNYYEGEYEDTVSLETGKKYTPFFEIECFDGFSTADLKMLEEKFNIDLDIETFVEDYGIEVSNNPISFKGGIKIGEHAKPFKRNKGEK